MARLQKSPVARRATGSQNSVARRQNPVAMAPGHPLSFNAAYMARLLNSPKMYNINGNMFMDTTFAK